MSYDEMSPLFCTVLHSLMKALARWFLSSVWGTSENKGTKKAWREQDQLNVHRFLLDYHKQKDLVEQCTEHPEIPPPVDFEEDIDGPDVKAELPAHIAKEAMERCIHLPTDPRLSLNIQL
ncbi:unnamed protein product [Oncorhynchus mykiss]|uniref:TTI1 C-terminal TPR domain-containing protein n=1 Tax=Oncorhynchus mykiss TaxID=8022 RepID=A0A060WU92_ONCMY|nr:unnamed protein product [Oncorhynchus mykiss]